MHSISSHKDLRMTLAYEFTGMGTQDKQMILQIYDNQGWYQGAAGSSLMGTQ